MIESKFQHGYNRNDRRLTLFAFLYDDNPSNLKRLSYVLQRYNPDGRWIIAIYENPNECPVPVKNKGCVGICYEINNVDWNLELVRGIIECFTNARPKIMCPKNVVLL